jgi:hypothetical protein
MLGEKNNKAETEKTNSINKSVVRVNIDPQWTCYSKTE